MQGSRRPQTSAKGQTQGGFRPLQPLSDRAELNLTAEDNRRDRGSQAIHRRPEQREKCVAYGKGDPACPAIMLALKCRRRVGRIDLVGIVFIGLGCILQLLDNASCQRPIAAAPASLCRRPSVPWPWRDNDPAAARSRPIVVVSHAVSLACKRHVEQFQHGHILPLRRQIAG